MDIAKLKERFKIFQRLRQDAIVQNFPELADVYGKIVARIIRELGTKPEDKV